MLGVIMDMATQSQELVEQSKTVPWWHPQKVSASDASNKNSKPEREDAKPWWMDESEQDKPSEPERPRPKIDQAVLHAQRVWETPSKPAPKRPSKEARLKDAVKEKEVEQAQSVEPSKKTKSSSKKNRKRLSQPARERLTKILDEQAQTRLSAAIAPAIVVERTGPAFVGLTLEQLSEVELDWDAPVPCIEPAPFATREELRAKRRRQRKRELQRRAKRKGKKIRRAKTRKVEAVSLSHSEKDAFPIRALPSFDEELIGGPVNLRIEQAVVLENDRASLSEGPWLPRSLQFLHRYLSS